MENVSNMTEHAIFRMSSATEKKGAYATKFRNVYHNHAA